MTNFSRAYTRDPAYATFIVIGYDRAAEIVGVMIEEANGGAPCLADIDETTGIVLLPLLLFSDWERIVQALEFAGYKVEVREDAAFPILAKVFRP